GDEKVRHLCRLRGLLKENIAGLREAFGDESDALPELRHGEQKIASVELTIQTHGDPEILCAAPADDPPLPAMPRATAPLLGPGDAARREAAPEGEPREPATARRKAVATTASGAALIVTSGALLGVMSYYLARGSHYDRAARGFDPYVEHTDDEVAAHNAVLERGK